MFRFLIRVRILPIAIFVAGLIVTVKIGDVADLMGGSKPSLQVAKVHAQGAPTPLQAPPAPAAQAPAEAPAVAQAPTTPAPVPAAPESTSDPANDPTLLTQNEIDLLQSLAERRETIEKQTQEMNVRQGLLQAAEQRIDKKIQELKTLQTAIDALIQKHDEQEEQRVQSLVKIYEGMKPKEAGRIFETLDIDTLLLVAEKMKERKLSPILAAIDPEKAKELTVKIATARKLPLPGAGG